MNIDLINHIAATIRRVEGVSRTPGHAETLAEAIVSDLSVAYLDSRTVLNAVDTLVEDGWAETNIGGALSHVELENLSRVVLRSLTEG